MNIIDYIEKHKDEDFYVFKFTEVDNLILSLLSYIDFKDIVPSFNGSKITLKNAAYKIENKNIKYRGLFFRKVNKMLSVMKNTKRYGNLILYNYMDIVNNEMQFSAITIKLNDNSIFVSYSGTDTSIIGWEEDFKMAYLYPGASQKYASVYLNKTVSLLDKNVIVGGHSKGGNLAISAVMNAKFYIRKKVKIVYNNDGPGFLKEQLISKKYKNIENKIKMYVPESSIIGMILYHLDNYTVVKARGFMILEHDAFNWLCTNNSFIKTKLSKRSQNIEANLTKKLEELPINTRIKLVNNIFDIFKKCNIKDTKEITFSTLFNLIKNFSYLDKESQNLLIEFILLYLKKK